LSTELRAEEAVDQLFSIYGDDVYRFALFTLHDENEAMDVVQETFFRAFRAWHTFRNESSPKTWLLHIARNYMFDMLRKRRSERSYQNQVSIPLVSTGPESIIELIDLIHQLPQPMKQVILLRCIHDLSVEQTASVLGWTTAKVRVTQHRGLKKLRALLQEPNCERGGLANHDA
jgi:RNA polymerase sigma-70 factor (ECF subfamily)